MSSSRTTSYGRKLLQIKGMERAQAALMRRQRRTPPILRAPEQNYRAELGAFIHQCLVTAEKDKLMSFAVQAPPNISDETFAYDTEVYRRSVTDRWSVTEIMIEGKRGWLVERN